MFTQSSILQMSRVFSGEHTEQFARFRDVEAHFEKVKGG